MPVTPTVDDFVSALKAYWRANPDGGSEDQILQLAAHPSRDWDVAVIGRWLDVLAQTMVDQGYPLAAPTYDGGIAPLVAQVGVDKALTALSHIVERAKRGSLSTEERDAQVARFDDAIATAQAQLASVRAGMREIQATGVSGPNINAVASALNGHGISGLEAAIAQLERARDRL
jgi:hypothetical protein